MKRFFFDQYQRRNSWPVIVSGVALAFFCISLLFQVITRRAEAIPAFARKYRTSCQTCHVAYPKLTPFGEAFRNSGYQYPEDDEDKIKEYLLKLGSDAYKRVFPKSVWPNSIPGNLPIAVRGAVVAAVNFKEKSENNFEFQPPEINLITAGALSENISWWVGAHLFAGGSVGSLGRSFVQFSHLFDWWDVPRHLFNLRVGQIDPNAVAFSGSRSLTMSGFRLGGFSLLNYAMGQSTAAAAHGLTAAYQGGLRTQNPGGGGAVSAANKTQITGGFTPSSPQLGLELFGIVASRFYYAIGMVNGNGVTAGEFFDNNSAKDFYARLAFKIGGMGFDGKGKIQAKPWRDNAFTMGVSGYYGTATVEQRLVVKEGVVAGKEEVKFRDGTDVTVERVKTSEWNSNYWRMVGDVRFNFWDIDLFGAVLYGQDTNPNNKNVSFQTLLYFVEADWVIYPWLIAALRFEDGYAGTDKLVSVYRQGIVNLTFLIRANMKLSFEGVVDFSKLTTDGNHKLLIGLDTAF